MFAITDIQSQLQYGGARPSLMAVQISNPITGLGAAKQRFMILAASIPESTVGAIPIPYFGRTINVAGVRSYSPWSVQVLNDESWDVRAGFETWVNNINTPITNIRATGTSSPAAYKGEGQVFQYSQTGALLQTYTFNGMIPISVGAIQLSWSAGNSVETFGVTFAIDEFLPQGQTV